MFGRKCVLPIDINRMNDSTIEELEYEAEELHFLTVKCLLLRKWVYTLQIGKLGIYMYMYIG